MSGLESFNHSDSSGIQPALWQGDNHPFAAPKLEATSSLAGATDAPTELPAPVQQAIEKGAPVRFSTGEENAAAGREPDYYLSPEGKLVANPKATPSPDGSINIEMQNSAAEAKHKSLAQAIENRTEGQKKFAEDLIRHFQKTHPGESVPSWMEHLANAKPNIPDFTPFPPSPQAPVEAPPENGFVNRGVGPGGGRGTGGYQGNGGFDNKGFFKGNGSQGDGTLRTGHYDGQGKPLGDGQVVKAKEIYDYMTEHHKFTPAQASGILGNMQTESSFNTAAYNKHEGAVGLIQWEGPRRTALENFSKNDPEHRPVTDWKLQVDFMVHELKTTESGAWAKIQKAETPGQVAAAFDQHYERSAGTSRGERVANAENIHRTIATA